MEFEVHVFLSFSVQSWASFHIPVCYFMMEEWGEGRDMDEENNGSFLGVNSLTIQPAANCLTKIIGR
jgi:hypothetical protein